MKRLLVLLLALSLFSGLGACGKKEKTAPNPQQAHTQTTGQEEPRETETHEAVVPEETTQAEEEPISLNLELVGPWHLDPDKNDLTGFADSLDLFPGFGEWGASMEIRGNGDMSWYIGAEGWHGIYTTEGSVLHAQLTSDLTQSPQNWDMRITSENGTTGLEMDYQDMTIYWVYGDQEETAIGNSVPSNWEKATEDEP